MKYHGYIYKLTLLRDTDSFKAGELYIGKHNGQKSNYYSGGKIVKNMITKHGENIFERTIIAVDIKDEDLLSYLEIYYIDLYKTNRIKHGINLNLTDGGEGTTGYKKPETALTIKKKEQQRYYKNDKYKIYQYDILGNYIQSFRNAVEAAKELGYHKSTIAIKCKQPKGKNIYKNCMWEIK